MPSQNVLLYIYNIAPKNFNRKMNGPVRCWGIMVKCLESIGLNCKTINIEEAFQWNQDGSRDLSHIEKLEQWADYKHCMDPLLLTDLLLRDIKVHCFGPYGVGNGRDRCQHGVPATHRKAYEYLKKLHPTIDETPYFYPHHNDNSTFYDVIPNWRYSPGSDMQEVWHKLHIFQSAIETNEIFPNKTKRKYVLWAGYPLDHKGHNLLGELTQRVKLPPQYEWKILERYTLEEFFDVLDSTILHIVPSRFETHCNQLFEAWAKACPTLYRRNLWGWNEYGIYGNVKCHGAFYGCGGFTYEEHDLDCIVDKIHEIFNLDEETILQQGRLSRSLVEQFDLQTVGQQMVDVYASYAGPKPTKKSTPKLTQSIPDDVKHRNDLPRLLDANGLNGICAEVGVWVGWFSQQLVNPQLGIKGITHLFSIDNWYNEERNRLETIKRMTPYKNSSIIRMDSTKAARLFRDETFDLVYIDADHGYESVRDDIVAWWPKIKPTGILSGHDYMLPGVMQAVDEFVTEYNLTLHLLKDNESWNRSWVVFK